jgi:hypothetical protein
MGLGKTLQALLFLAWLIEEEEKWPDAAPWNPILIVAPLILLDEDGPWLKDIRTYFEGDGAVFQPWLCLHARHFGASGKTPAKKLSWATPP